jgi:hypothetical protein
MDLVFVVGLMLTALLLLVQHYYPWRRSPSPIARYGMGSAAILAGITLWLGEQHQWQTLLMIYAFYAVGGAAVVWAYATDRAANTEQRVRMYEREGK